MPGPRLATPHAKSDIELSQQSCGRALASYGSETVSDLAKLTQLMPQSQDGSSVRMGISGSLDSLLYAWCVAQSGHPMHIP